MLSKGELCRAPIKNPKRVLDLGTGTGIWAMDFAELATTQHLLRTVTNYEISSHPDAQVLGTQIPTLANLVLC